MSTVRFSVVVPTRERAGTLRHALRTCLDQQFDDYEVIVSDNFSSPATKAVADEAASASAKVRYVRTPEPIAMSTNWEFGLSHARGEYVLVLGDDDGLLPHALRELDALANRTGARAIRWDAAFYTWPDFALEGQGDFLGVPLGRGLRERDSDEAIREVATFRELYTALPMLYNAAVHRDVLAELRRRTGRVFAHRIPDVYSGMAVAHAAGRFLSTSVPMSVSGQSGASNGIAVLFKPGGNAISREFSALNEKAGFRAEPTVPDLPVFPEGPVADAYTFARRTLFPASDVVIDRRQLTRACVAKARVTQADWPAALRLIRGALGDDPALLRWFDAEFAAAPYPLAQPPLLNRNRLGLEGTTLNLDAAAFGVADVAGAALLCDRLLRYRSTPPEYVATSGLDAAAEKIKELQSVCDEREQAVLRLHRAAAELLQQCDEREQAILRLHYATGELRQACDERLALVRQLTARVSDLEAQLKAERRWSFRRPFRAAKRLLHRAAAV